MIASVRPGYSLERCLDALLKQRGDQEVEIIVADCAQDIAMPDFTKTYPDVLWLPFPAKTTLPILWGAGIARATGPIIAVTESTCLVDDHWLAAILQAHEASHPVIGGAVEMAAGKTWVDWAAYFCEYGQFMQPCPEGPVDELPGNNISFKRWVLHKGQAFVQHGFWKTYWCRHLQEEGIPLISTPSMVVGYTKSYRLIPFLMRRFHHGRCFAGMRLTHTTPLMRACYIVGSPLLPFLFLSRVTRTVASKRRYIKAFVLSLPVSCLAILSWSWGEFWGYLTGQGNSCDHID